MNNLHTGKTELVLWGTKTSRVMRAHWALLELDIPYQNNPVEARTPQMDQPGFLAVSPQKKIPVLVDGELVLSESSAIVTYLAERYSSNACQLIPLDVVERAKYFQWVSFACMELDATALYVLRRHEELAHIYGEEPGTNATAREYFIRMINSAAERIPRQGYLLGEQFTGADIIMTTCLNWARRYQIEVPPRFENYLALIDSRPAYHAALEANQNIPTGVTK